MRVGDLQVDEGVSDGMVPDVGVRNDSGSRGVLRIRMPGYQQMLDAMDMKWG